MSSGVDEINTVAVTESYKWENEDILEVMNDYHLLEERGHGDQALTSKIKAETMMKFLNMLADRFRQKIPIDFPDHTGKTLLHYAVILDLHEHRKLLAAYLDGNDFDVHLQTPLNLFFKKSGIRPDQIKQILQVHKDKASAAVAATCATANTAANSSDIENNATIPGTKAARIVELVNNAIANSKKVRRIPNGSVNVNTNATDHRVDSIAKKSKKRSSSEFSSKWM